MSLADDLRSQVAKFYAEQWTTRDGQKVPEADEVRLGNDAVRLDGTVLYADLVESTKLVSDRQASLAAEVYKAFLYCAAKVVEAEGGVVTAYDGDRLMAVFVGDLKNSSAARAALKITWCMRELVSPLAKKQYPTLNLEDFRQVTGIDTSSLFVARTGARAANDLVWIGRAANFAAKLSEIRDGGSAAYVTSDVFSVLSTEAKISSDGRPMWEPRTWSYNQMTIYRSSWQWTP